MTLQVKKFWFKIYKGNVDCLNPHKITYVINKLLNSLKMLHLELDRKQKIYELYLGNSMVTRVTFYYIFKHS